MKLDAQKWNILSGAILVASSYLASSLVKKTWGTIGKKDPPQHPRLPTANLKTAMVVAAVSGVASVILKFAVTRFAGDQWLKAGGELPAQNQ